MKTRRLARQASFVLLGLALLLASCAFGGPPTDGDGLRRVSLTWDGVIRAYGEYVPEALAADAPAVLLLHGGFSSASDFWETEFARSWRRQADAAGFLLVLPEGAPDPGDPAGHHWNDCRVDAGNADSTSTEDDVGFLGQVILSVIAAHGVDADRVYVAGVSNGGMMAYRLAMESAERPAAVAAVVANLPDPSECPLRGMPLPVLIMNGTADAVMPYDGGCVAGLSCLRGSVRSTAATVAFWVFTNGASATPAVTDVADSVASDDSTVRVFRFDGGPGGNDVLLYRVQGGGHCAPGPEPMPGVAKNRDIDAAAEIWQFFREHRRVAP